MVYRESGSHLLVKSLYFSILFIVFFSVLYGFAQMAGTLLASVLLALALKPFVLKLEVKGFSRGQSLGIVFVSLLFLVFSALLFLIPLIVSEIHSLIENFPIYQKIIIDKVKLFYVVFSDKIPQLQDFDIQGKIASFSKGVVNSLTTIASLLVEWLAFASLVPFITFFLLYDGHLINKFLLGIVPNRYFEMAVLLFSRIMGSLQLYIRGQIIDASAVGVMTAVGLSIIGFPFALVIGLVAGVGNLIPYLGPIMGMIPAIIIVAVTPEWLDLTNILMVVGVFAIVQFIEGTFIYPMAVGKSVELHPLAVIIGITAGGQIGGIVGMIVVIPLIAIGKVTVEVFYKYLKAYKVI